MKHTLKHLLSTFACAAILPGCSNNVERPISDHFNGEKFINPTLSEQFSPSVGKIFQLIREDRPKWPDNIENTGITSLQQPLHGDDLNLTFINHASFLIQFKGLNILTDPVWSQRVSPFSWFGPKRIRPPGLTLDDLPPIDIILISHNHYDHFDKSTLRKLNQKFSPKIIVPIGDRKLAESVGFNQVQELDWWESVTLGESLSVTFAPTQHSSARGLFDRDKSLWGSYFIKKGKHSIYFGGDAGYSSHYKDIKQRLGAADIALLGIGAYAPQYFMKPVHMNPQEAVQAHLDLEAKLSIGMHYETFQLSTEAFEQPVQDLQQGLDALNVATDSFTTMKVGESRYFSATSQSD